MAIKTSLKKKSVWALTFYLVFIITVLGSVTYWAVEAPVRDAIEKKLDLRTQLLAAQIEAPINRSIGLLHSLAALGHVNMEEGELVTAMQAMFANSHDIVASGGLWQHHTDNAMPEYGSLFFNKRSDGGIDRIYSYNNPQSSGYHQERWYQSAVDKPQGSVSWSEVYVDPFTQVQMITASEPYYVDGKFAGIATVDLSLNALFDFIHQHSERHELGINIRDENNQVITEHNFQLLANVYIGRLQFGDFHWTMEVVNSRHLVTDEVFEQVMNVERGVLPFLLVCVLAGYFCLNHYIIKPIIRIARQVDHSKLGGIIDVPYHSKDEIGHLIDVINEKTVFLEQEKVKAQASTDAKTAFLATLSHEIRTPMNSVLGTAQLLKKTPLDSEQQKYLKTLYDSGEHMMTLLNEILDYSKIEQGHMEFDHAPFPLKSLIGSINSVYHTLCDEKGLEFNIVSSISEQRWYRADKARLRQVLFNLVNNAVKFTRRGFIEVCMEEEQQAGRNLVCIQVKDSGIGIALDAQQKIFQPFVQAESSTTRRFGGTGLGLSIVKQICDEFEGSVTVSSQLGLGTCFTVELYLQPCAAEKKSDNTKHKLNYQGLRALVVEDNRTNTFIIENMLKNKGFVCQSVSNGQEAVDLVAEQEFDIIFMDNHMPIMDGVESTRIIRSLPEPICHTLIFACTADVFKETYEMMLASGCDAVIAKPIIEEELDDTLLRFASRLFEHRPAAQDPLYSVDKAFLLVELCMALENEELHEARQVITALASDHAINGSDIAPVLEKIAQALDRYQKPQQEDVDLLAMYLEQ